MASDSESKSQTAGSKSPGHPVSTAAGARGRRVLIVGGLGYVGSRLAHALSAEASVTVSSRSLSPAREAWVKAHSGRVSRVEFDSATQDRLPVEGEFDCIVNAAGPGASEAARDEGRALGSALRTVRACSQLTAESAGTRLVHFSTFHIYGAHDRERFSEEDKPEPVHPYGRINLQCEKAALAAGGAVLRPTNVVGAPAHNDFGAQSGLVFLDLCRQAVFDHRIRLRTNGVAYRDFVPMADAIEAVKVLISGDTDRAFQIFNLSSGRAVRLDMLALEIQSEAQEMLGREIPVEKGSELDRFADPFEVTNDRLRSLGWQLRGSLREDIRETLQFFVESAR